MQGRGVVRCEVCGGRFYHQDRCELDGEATVVEAMSALRWAFAGIPLYVICPCELGYPGVFTCIHKTRARMPNRVR